ncbi:MULTISPECIES: hypothetical protein [unclassified Leptolyngbya]|uniref:hypothetical protein n=1 Tax=unclassified Leptolyngbya TaxID=2650499 RepID=UPI0016893F03|nr:MULTISPECIES: hypothetical protein [unclassified Leptolyngbya]MBD1912835.1 hypothetical protein [Leptolyngbya sp. FACHB-8]MBD2157782.1 hypothetical protein [Leptolyngbya sp. FACHB-16]
MATKEFYNGWLIQISREQLGYSYQCSAPEQQTMRADMCRYATVDAALHAAKLRADLEGVRLSLTTFLHGKLQLLLLCPEERSLLEDSIAQFIDLTQHQCNL